MVQILIKLRSASGEPADLCYTELLI